jgi:hemoglobin
MIMSMVTDGPLYERIGGQPGIDRIVDDFYRRVTSDPVLQPYFEHSSMDHLAAMQKEFFAVALGGAVTFSGAGLADAHRQLHISGAAFSKFAEHLVDCLTDLGYDEELVHSAVDRISLYADDVLGGQGEGG